MKKYLLLTLLISIISIVSSQEVNSVALNDTVYAKMGETVTIYPLLNDYDPDGDNIIISDVQPGSVDILGFTDSTITFKVPDYSLIDNLIILYNHQEYNYFPDCHAKILIKRILNIDTLNCNQIKTPIFPGNIQFWDAYINPSDFYLFKYPSNAETSTIFDQALWIGGKDINDNLHLAADKYHQKGNDFWSGPLTDDGLAMSDSINAGRWFRTWKVRKSDVIEHLNNYSNPSYQMPEAIKSWPAHGDIRQAEYLAPFVDVDLDGEYHPENGDYPLIKGDESIFFIYNDAKEHGESEGLPMGIEIHCMAWAYEEANDKNALNNTIFLSYKIFNRSMQTYYDTYISIFTDFDLGYYADDFVECNVSNGNYFVYNGREIDGAGEPNSYGENPPTQGVCILGGPFMDNDGIDNPLRECNESINGTGFGDGIEDNERFGMTGFLQHSNGGPEYMSDPTEATEYYNSLSGYWKDGSPRVYGGNAHSDYGGDSLFPARFMWPGDSDPCNWGTDGLEPSWDSLWTEETTGNMPSDRRGMGSAGPFTFEAGSVHYLDLALVTAPGDQGKNSKDLLQDYIVQIKQDYLLNPEEFGNQYLEIPEQSKIAEQLLVYPNPAEGDIIRFELGNEVTTEYSIYNAAGQVIEQGFLAAQKEHSLSIGHLQSGWYILEVKVDGRVLRSKLIL